MYHPSHMPRPWLRSLATDASEHNVNMAPRWLLCARRRRRNGQGESELHSWSRNFFTPRNFFPIRHRPSYFGFLWGQFLGDENLFISDWMRVIGLESGQLLAFSGWRLNSGGRRESSTLATARAVALQIIPVSLRFWGGELWTWSMNSRTEIPHSLRPNA